MATTSSHYIIILCGGSGPRLWPLSRASHPKPFLKLFSQNSLLKETYLRAIKIVKPDHIYIITHQKYLHFIKTDLKNLISPRNIITEPKKKNTALAILHASAVIFAKNPKAVITTFNSDHAIGKLPRFIKTIKFAISLAVSQQAIITIGIKPSFPSISFGYILTGIQSGKFFPVKNFIEKPPREIAEKLIKSHHSFWNSGIYTFSIDGLLSQFQKHAPKYYSYFQELSQGHHTDRIYHDSPNLSFDIAISEKSKDMLTIPADFDWSDIGEWKTIYQQLPTDKRDNAVLGKATNFVSVDSQKCLISGQPDKLIGIVNLDNLAIIDTPDALLVCNLADNGSFHVRDLVTKIVADDRIKKFFLTKNDQ